MCMASLGSAGGIVGVVTIANWLNFLFRCGHFIIAVLSVILCYFDLLMGVLIFLTFFEEFLHSFGVRRAVMLRSRDVVLVFDGGLVIVNLCAYCRDHHFVAVLKLRLILTLRPREVLV